MTTPALSSPAAALVLRAANLLDADDLALDGHARRDAAVLLALDLAWQRQDLTAITTLASGYDALLLSVPELVPPAGPAEPSETSDARLSTERTRAGRTIQPRMRLRAVGNAERRHRGAFSTPPEYAATLAERAVPALPDLPAGRAPAVVDPACGAGALLRAALARLLELGVPPDRAAGALHGVDADPVAIELCRAVLAADLTQAGHPCRPDDLAGQILTGDALLGPTPHCPAAADGALSWHETFPQILARPDQEPEPVTGWRGGFDVVVANPPWERLKVLARDWDGLPPDGLAQHRAGDARGLRGAGRHPLTGAGELNAYLPFVETCWRLLAPDGRAAVLVPAGIASDRSSAPLLEVLAQAGSLQRLHLFDPPAAIFSGVSARVGVAIVELWGGPTHARFQGRPGRSPGNHGKDLEDLGDASNFRDSPDSVRGAPEIVRESGVGARDPLLRVAVGLGGPDEDPAPREWVLPASLLRVLNPNTGATPLFGSATDATIVTAAHRGTPVLVRRDPVSGRVVDDAWSLRLITPLHMTRDAVHFRSAPGEGLLPLWEAKNCSVLDPLGGSAAGHRYWVPAELVHARFADLTTRGWLAGYRNVSTTVAPRTLMPTPLPIAGVGNSLPLLTAPMLPLLLAALATLPVDYLLRQKHAGANVNFFKLEQVPVPPPSRYLAPAPWQSELSVGEWVLQRLARAVVWRPGLDGLREELAAHGVYAPARALSLVPGPAGGGDPGPAGPIGPDAALLAELAQDRAQARAELDAAHAVLLGFSLDDLAHVLTTFGALRLREERTLGRFVTAERVLAAYRQLTE